MINLIDVLILVAALIGIANGYRRGFWLSLAQYVGLTVGVLLGAASARYVLDYLQINNSSARPLGAVLVLVIGGSLGSSIGFAVGEPIRRSILRTGVHMSTDSVAGAALSGFAVLLMCWFLGLSFSRGPSPDISQRHRQRHPSRQRLRRDQCARGFGHVVALDPEAGRDHPARDRHLLRFGA